MFNDRSGGLVGHHLCDTLPAVSSAAAGLRAERRRCGKSDMLKQQPALTFLLLFSLCFSKLLLRFTNLTRKLDFRESKTRVCQLAGAGDDMSFRFHSRGVWRMQPIVCCCLGKTGEEFLTRLFFSNPNLVFVLELCD